MAMRRETGTQGDLVVGWAGVRVRARQAGRVLRGRFGVAINFVGHYAARIDFRPDELDLLWRRSR
jgi:hypothetical protein